LTVIAEHFLAISAVMAAAAPHIGVRQMQIENAETVADNLGTPCP
jgi:hypothetical protein